MDKGLLNQGDKAIFVREDSVYCARVLERKFKTHTEYCWQAWRFVENEWWLYIHHISYSKEHAIGEATFLWDSHMLCIQNIKI